MFSLSLKSLKPNIKPSLASVTRLGLSFRPITKSENTLSKCNAPLSSLSHKSKRVAPLKCFELSICPPLESSFTALIYFQTTPKS